MAHAIFALTTRGLEAVSARELAALPGTTVTETAYRRILAACHGSLTPLLHLRTADDVYLSVVTWTDIGHTRDSLAHMRHLAERLDLRSHMRVIAGLRPVAPKPSFSVTASFVGRRNYSSDEIKTVLASGIESGHPWRYTPDDRQADLNLRLFLEADTAYVGLRLSKSPLHERGYKQVERPGSLKPPVAAAMLMLAGAAGEERLLDPCCGTGTIVIEAACLGMLARGGDIDAEAVRAAWENIAAAAVQAQVEHWDARHLPLPDASFGCIVTNLPWGRQIAVDDAAALYPQLNAEMERVLAPGGTVVTLTSAPERQHFARLNLIEQIEISLFGQRPIISVWR